MTITVANTDLHGRFSVLETKRVFTDIESAKIYIKTAPIRKSGEEYFNAYDENGEFVQEVFKPIFFSPLNKTIVPRETQIK
jgi:hypothetical protein